ncbi:hypothetical protein OEZ86_012252 [Tetradesmus obliquus]|nr:hypothetical protein OEZ86_012252 [Tetradesmus obliquus]
MHGGLGRKFRRKVPLFQVVEFYANGTAVEEYRPCTPQQLGLHPRDVVLFAPISRLAAPQRATIVVHDGKILVKTEIVKAIITADKAVLIKGRREADTQKLSQNILAANDQRLMSIHLAAQQQQQQEAARSAHTPLSAMGCGKAASAADLIRAADAAHGVGPAGGSRGAAKGSWSPLEAEGFGGSSSSRSEALARNVGGDLKDVPFEMLVLEVLLDATTEYFYTKVQHLHWMLESIAADIRQPSQPQGAMDKAHQLIPIQKFLTGLKSDVKETSAAVKAALGHNETLQELCLSWHKQQQQRAVWVSSELARQRARAVEEGYELDEVDPAAAYSVIYGHTRPQRTNGPSAGPLQHVRMLTEMLESYEREIQSLEGSINEAEEDLDNTRSLWHMQLDSSRNHIIMVNLWLSMLNISVMASTIFPAYFGMNLESPLPAEDSFYFFTVVGASLALAGLSYPASRFWYTHNWRKINQNKMFEHKMLRVLLVQNIEDVDEILRAVKRYRYKFVDRGVFRKLLTEALGNRALTQTHIDFLWQCYDRDRDGFIQECELIRPLNTYHTMDPAAAAAAAVDSPADAALRSALDGTGLDGSSSSSFASEAGSSAVSSVAGGSGKGGGSSSSSAGVASALEASYSCPDPWEQQQQQQQLEQPRLELQQQPWQQQHDWGAKLPDEQQQQHTQDYVPWSYSNSEDGSSSSSQPLQELSQHHQQHASAMSRDWVSPDELRWDGWVAPDYEKAAQQQREAEEAEMAGRQPRVQRMAEWVLDRMQQRQSARRSSKQAAEEQQEQEQREELRQQLQQAVADDSDSDDDYDESLELLRGRAGRSMQRQQEVLGLGRTYHHQQQQQQQQHPQQPQQQQQAQQEDQEMSPQQYLSWDEDARYDWDSYDERGR